MYGGDEVSAIVVDVGSHTLKAGYAGEDTPKAVFPSSVGVLERTADDQPAESGADLEMKDAEEAPAKNGAKSGKQYIINQFSYRRDHMEVVSPYGTEGYIEDWDVTEALWDHAFKKYLTINPTEHPMLLAEPPSVPKQQREKCVELMFEKHSVPALFLAKNPVLTSFASGKPTSLVVDIGGGGTCVTAVHDGYALRKGNIRTKLGGDRLSDLMLRHTEQFERPGVEPVTIRPRYSFKRVAKATPGEFEVTPLDFPNTTASYREYCRREIASDICQTVCRVSEVHFVESENTNIPTVPYELPDGNTIEVGLERFKVPETLFQPDLLPTFPSTDAIFMPDGTPIKSLPGLVHDAINKCDVDVRKDLYTSILLTGGVSLVPNLRERLERELSDQVSAYTARVKVTTPNAMAERKFSVFIGGSILASLGSFQQMWMSKMEYDEHGAALVHRKCP